MPTIPGYARHADVARIMSALSAPAVMFWKDGVWFQSGPACQGSISMYGVAPAASAWLMNCAGHCWPQAR